MMGAIDHMDHTFTIGKQLLKTFNYPRIAIERSSPAGEKRRDEPKNNMMPADNSLRYAERTLTKTVVEDSKWVVEKYDQNGKLIRLTPPGYIPFGRMLHSILA